MLGPQGKGRRERRQRCAECPDRQESADYKAWLARSRLWHQWGRSMRKASLRFPTNPGCVQRTPRRHGLSAGRGPSPFPQPSTLISMAPASSPQPRPQVTGGRTEAQRDAVILSRVLVGGKAGLSTQDVCIQSLCISNKTFTFAHGPQHGPWGHKALV